MRPATKYPIRVRHSISLLDDDHPVRVVASLGLLGGEDMLGRHGARIEVDKGAVGRTLVLDTVEVDVDQLRWSALLPKHSVADSRLAPCEAWTEHPNQPRIREIGCCPARHRRQR